MIKIIKDINKMRRICEDKRQKGIRIGFVPTMGALHEGHLSLIRIALKRTDFVVVSIYINPVQFGPDEDFEKYPRNLDKDISKIESIGAHAVFTPSDKTMYRDGYSTFVNVEGLTEVLCGLSRATHFRGVTTVVAKLFNIIRPHVAVFGQKDAQQLLVIKKMVWDLDMDIEIEEGPIIREFDGLAMSSRNKNLNKEERKQAAVLYQSLESAQKLVRNGVTDSKTIIEAVREVLDRAPLIKTDYVEIVSLSNMNHVFDISDGALLVIAMWLGETRLIDNTFITGRGEEI